MFLSKLIRLRTLAIWDSDVTVLDRYVFGEFAKVISVATLAILGIFFGTVEFRHVMELMAKLNVPWNTLLLVDALQLPVSIVYCLPAAVVAAAALVWIRQHQSSEILALQICGVSRRRILAPFIAIGMIAGGVGFFLGDMVAPNSRYLAHKLLLARVNNSDRPFPGRAEIILRDRGNKVHQWMIFGESEGNSAKPFVALDFNAPASPVLVYAESALWKKGVWNLDSGVLCQLPLDQSRGEHYKFGKMEVGGLKPIARAVENAPKTMFDRTVSELKAEIDKLSQAGKRVPPDMLIQLYRRFSQPLSCVLLLIAAAPLVLFRRARISTSTQFVYVGVLVVSFFLLQDITYAMGENARIAPWIAAFLPSAMLCLGGLGAGWILNRA
jgi:lipopolysaccharide export system permease protein